MGYFNVVKPCVITGSDRKVRHYTKPTDQPIVVEDEVAAPLVAAGVLEPYKPGVVAVSEHPRGWESGVEPADGGPYDVGAADSSPVVDPGAESVDDVPKPRTKPRGRGSESVES